MVTSKSSRRTAAAQEDAEGGPQAAGRLIDLHAQLAAVALNVEDAVLFWIGAVTAAIGVACFDPRLVSIRAAHADRAANRANAEYSVPHRSCG